MAKAGMSDVIRRRLHYLNKEKKLNAFDFSFYVCNISSGSGFFSSAGSGSVEYRPGSETLIPFLIMRYPVSNWYHSGSSHMVIFFQK